jgi:hypothetical protein
LRLREVSLSYSLPKKFLGLCVKLKVNINWIN